jgi:hypothetical protein
MVIVSYYQVIKRYVAMRTLVTAVIMLLFTAAATAQEKVPLTKQERKAVKQEQKKQNEMMLTHNTATALKAGQFVLKADQLRGRGGFITGVNPTTNFIAVEGKDAYVQVASESGPGYNGLGGVTLKGRITSMDIEQNDKNGFYNVVMNTMGINGQLTIMMNINQTGEVAYATVRTNYGGRIEMNGVLVPWTGTGKAIFKGRQN